MKTGDIVRFRNGWKGLKIIENNKWSSMPADHDKSPLALLIEYESWEKIATVMYNGNVFRIAARDIEKAGKKDIPESENDNGKDSNKNTNKES